MKGASLIAPFGLRMPDELRECISYRAKKNGRSMNAEIIQILEDAIKRDGDDIPPLGDGTPNQRFFVETSIAGRLERVEGTLQELIEQVKKREGEKKSSPK